MQVTQKLIDRVLCIWDKCRAAARQRYQGRIPAQASLADSESATCLDSGPRRRVASCDRALLRRRSGHAHSEVTVARDFTRSTAVGAVEPFSIVVGDDVLDDVRDRVARTRWAHDFANDDWRYGTNGGYLKELAKYWLDHYDWRVHERAMNA